MLNFFSGIASGNGQLLLTALTIIALIDLKQRCPTPGQQPTCANGAARAQVLTDRSHATIPSPPPPVCKAGKVGDH